MAAYALLAMFTVQILTMSVLHPIWFIKYLRARIKPAGHDRDARTYIERRLAQFRALNTGIAVLGLLLLGWLFGYTRQPTWDDGPIEALLGVYFVVQMLPVCLVSCIAARINKQLTLAMPKRKASLQPRRLFDFISPSIVALAVVIYFLFAALVLYVARDPFPGFAGPLTSIGVVTIGYVVIAFAVYMTLYRTRMNPLDAHAERMREIGRVVKIAVYTCIGSVVCISLNLMLIVLDLQRWEPFGLTVCYVIAAIAIACSTRQSVTRLADTDGFGPSAAS